MIASPFDLPRDLDAEARRNGRHEPEVVDMPARGPGGRYDHGREVAAEAERLRVGHEARAVVVAEGAPSPAELAAEFYDAAELDTLPSAEPLIADVITRNAYAILRGRDGTYKTFTALDWSLSLACGRRWQGKQTERVKVLYVAGEGIYGMAARVNAWRYAWQCAPEPGWFTARRSAVNLFTAGPALDDLIRRIEIGGHGLVVVDTLRRASGSADGNSSDMGVVVDNLDRIKRATGNGSVLVVTHTDKGDNDSRGFSGIEDDADIVWHAKPGEDQGTVALTCTKMKDGPDGRVIQLAAKKVLDSVVLESYSPQSAGSNPTAADELIIDALRASFATTGATANQLIVVTGLASSTFYKARGRLESAGRITLTPKGSGYVLRPC